MRIGIDISVCAFNRAGSARYAASLLPALQKCTSKQDITLVPLSMPSSLTALGSGLKRKGVTLFWELLYAPFLLPRQARQHELDLLHLTIPTPIGRSDCAVVTTMHDMIPILFPQWFSTVMGIRLRRWIRVAARRSDHIITDSFSTQRDFEQLGLAPNVPITITHLGAGVAASSMDGERGATTETVGPRAPYILSVGTLEPRKNLGTVLSAYQLLSSRLDNLPELVIVGATGWMAEEIKERAKQLALTGKVKLTGYVSDQQLQQLYRGASVLVYPSLYEGFGIPPLEAMGNGCPVIASNRSSLPEVVGDAGILVDPTDDKALADAMQRLVSDATLATALREQGYTQAAKFTWEACAEKTLSVYYNVLN